jgi:hypothetical protein
MTRVFLCSLLIVQGGCATSFTGSAHITGGRATCEKKCAEQSLPMSALVYMGEYSSACVCEVPGHAGSSATAGASASAAVGVMMQMSTQQACRGGALASAVAAH